jgi:hypothetical protein
MKTISIFLLSFAMSGCFQTRMIGEASLRSLSPQDAGITGGGAVVVGTGALSVPTSNAVIARIQNGLEGKAPSTAGNFAKSLTQLKSNLPKTTDPTKATGYDQIQLLAYAACSDLVNGGTPQMQSVYNVKPKDTIAASKASLVSAGVRMMDQYVAGLASKGPTADEVTKIFSTLVDQVSVTKTNTTIMAFMAVCMAANTSGSTMMGF